MAAQPEQRSPRVCSSYSLGKAGADPKPAQPFLMDFLSIEAAQAAPLLPIKSPTTQLNLPVFRGFLRTLL